MLKAKLQGEQIRAMKSGDKILLDTIRFILSAVKNKEIEKRVELNDEEITTVIKKFAKELKESIDAFTKGVRPDLVTNCKKQLAIVTPYLPIEISDEELKKCVQQLVDQNKELASHNPNALKGVCVKELKTKAEPGRIVQILNILIGI